ECVQFRVSLWKIFWFSSPDVGFSPKPSLEFITHSRFPVANTCDNILRIPLHASHTAFKRDMDFAIRNSPGFGRA
uniref:HECT domain-containing protein n=1 Tax=Amphiprion ocellaris TaxID=80972 RepID=A0A3Q1BH38_AMPOC